MEAASQFYFGKSVREVNLAEAALMAGLFKAPSKFAPHVNLPASRARTNDVLTNLVEAGYMSAGPGACRPAQPGQDHRDAADAQPRLVPRLGLRGGRSALREGRGHYVLTARTTVDLGMQQAAQEAHGQHAAPHRTERASAATPAPWCRWSPTAPCAPWSAAWTTSDNQFNRASHARRQPGSSFKLYVYATAFENGCNPRSIVRDYGGACGNWAPQELLGGGGSGRSMPAIDAFKRVAQRAGRRPVAAGRPREGAWR